MLSLQFAKSCNSTDLACVFESHTLSQGNGLSMQGSPEMLPRFKTKVCSALHQFTCAGESVSKNKKAGAKHKVPTVRKTGPRPKTVSTAFGSTC